MPRHILVEIYATLLKSLFTRRCIDRNGTINSIRGAHQYDECNKSHRSLIAMIRADDAITGEIKSAVLSFYFR